MARLLMVDDEVIAAKALLSSIQDKLPDTEIFFAESAPQALSLLKEYAFDVVITDICMPQVSGLELLERVKKLWPSCYVIILTAYDHFDYAYQASRYENVRFLLKVEDLETITDTIKHAFEYQNTRILQQKKSQQMQQYIDSMRPVMQQSMLNRIIEYGGSLPCDEEFVRYGLTLQNDSNVLVAVTLVPDEEKLQVVSYLLGSAFTERGLNVIRYRSGSKIAFIVPKQEEGGNDNEIVSFVHGYLDVLTDDLSADAEDRITLSFAMTNSFVPLRNIRRVWELLDAAVTRMDDSGMVVLIDCYSTLSHVFPSMSDIILLNEMLTRREIDLFSETITRKINNIHGRTSADRRRIGSILEIMLYEHFDRDVINQVMEQHHLTQAILFGSSDTETDDWVRELSAMLHQVYTIISLKKEDTQLWLVDEINKYVQNHLFMPLTLSDIAKQFHYNSSYLSRLYKRTTGEGFNEYISRLRVDAACQRLISTDESLADIASNCGFQTTKYFSAAFKRQTGITPTAFRAQQA